MLSSTGGLYAPFFIPASGASMSTEREIGEHGARLTNLEDTVRGLDGKMDRVLEEIHTAKGGWKTLILVSGVAGSVGALVGKLLPFLNVKP